MSRENLDLARQVMEALGQRDPDALIALADPEVEWHSFFALSAKGVYRGHDGTQDYMRDLDDAFEAVYAEVDNTLAVGDVTVLVGRIRYRGRGSGVESESPAGWMLKFRDRKLVRFRAFRDPEGALETVGLGV
jgi:ketosteroid isomerase-like protein